MVLVGFLTSALAPFFSGVSVVMIFLPFMENYDQLIIGCVIYGIFAGGMPGNGPLVYSEDFKKDLPSAMGIASIGRGFAAITMGPVTSKYSKILFMSSLMSVFMFVCVSVIS